MEDYIIKFYFFPKSGATEDLRKMALIIFFLLCEIVNLEQVLTHLKQKEDIRLDVHKVKCKLLKICYRS